MDDPPIVDPRVLAYAESHSSPQPGYLADVAAHTRTFSVAAGMLPEPVVGRFLAMLVHLTGARRVLEIGTYTGYSALCVAEALPEGGRIVTCEVDPDHARMAAEHIAGTPFHDRIEIRLGRGLKTLAGLDGPFDLVHIDAERTGYAAYVDAVLPKLALRWLHRREQRALEGPRPRRGADRCRDHRAGGLQRADRTATRRSRS